jgi:DNA-binding beta-propeller fold protein YncE
MILILGGWNTTLAGGPPKTELRSVLSDAELTPHCHFWNDDEVLLGTVKGELWIFHTPTQQVTTKKQILDSPVTVCGSIESKIILKSVNQLVVIDSHKWKVLQTFKFKTFISKSVVSPVNNTCTVVEEGGRVSVIDLKSLTIKFEYRFNDWGQYSKPSDLQLSPDKKQVLLFNVGFSSGNDKRLYILSTEEKKVIGELIDVKAATPSAAAFFPQSSTKAICTTTICGLCLVDVVGGHKSTKYIDKDVLTSAVVSLHKKNILVVTTFGDSLLFYDAATMKPYQSFQFEGAEYFIAISPNESKIAFLSWEKKQWNLYLVDVPGIPSK